MLKSWSTVTIVLLCMNVFKYVLTLHPHWHPFVLLRAEPPMLSLDHATAACSTVHPVSTCSYFTKMSAAAV